MKFTFESPDVQALLSGVFRCSPQTYYRVDPETGRHVICPIRRNLMELGMCSKTASLYLKRAGLPITPFAPNDPAEADATPAPAPARRGPPPISEEEREAKQAKAEAVQNGKRYQLIMTSSRKNGAVPKHGVWDEIAGTVVELFHERDHAIELLTRLKTGKA